MGLLDKLRNKVRKHGLLGTFRHGAQRGWQRLLEFTPAQRRIRREREARDQEYDRNFGVDTGGSVQLNELDIATDNRDQGLPYWATDPDEFFPAVRSLAIHYEDYVFVDFGSGKGRVLLLASEFPFKRIVGVEFARELHEVAVENIRRFQSDKQKCRALEALCLDALSYELPPEPGVYYFYNPFGAELMAKIIANIKKSLSERPRDLTILYCNPKLEHLWQQAGFRKIDERNNCAILKLMG